MEFVGAGARQQTADNASWQYPQHSHGLPLAEGALEVGGGALGDTSLVYIPDEQNSNDLKNEVSSPRLPKGKGVGACRAQFIHSDVEEPGFQLLKRKHREYTRCILYFSRIFALNFSPFALQPFARRPSHLNTNTLLPTGCRLSNSRFESSAIKPVLSTRDGVDIHVRRSLRRGL